jgi:hypothetical protein
MAQTFCWNVLGIIIEISLQQIFNPDFGLVREQLSGKCHKAINVMQ